MSPTQAARRRTLGPKLTAFRTSRGWSQVGLGRLTGMNRGYWHNLETGERGITLRAIYALARVSDMSIWEVETELELPHQLHFFREMVAGLRDSLRVFPEIRTDEEITAVASYQLYRLLS